MFRRKLICAGVMLAATVAGLLVVQFATAPRVTAENYEKINDSMVLADVEALLGKPTGRSRMIAYLFFCSSNNTLREEFAATKVSDEGWRWDDNSGSIVVGFRPGGAVTFKRYDPPADEPLLNRLRRWLGV